MCCFCQTCHYSFQLGDFEAFFEGYVELDQEVAFGSYRTRIRELIEK